MILVTPDAKTTGTARKTNAHAAPEIARFSEPTKLLTKTAEPSITAAIWRTPAPFIGLNAGACSQGTKQIPIPSSARTTSEIR